MGKHDRRKSLKMRRRQGQVKKKAREARKAELHKVKAAPAKKTSRKAAPAPAAPA